MTIADMPRIVVADPLSAAHGLACCAACRRAGPRRSAALRERAAERDALIVRSQTKVTAEFLAAREPLTDRGPRRHRGRQYRCRCGHRPRDSVVNAPLGNVRSTANNGRTAVCAGAPRSRADAAVRAGAWKSGYEGCRSAGSAWDARRRQGRRPGRGHGGRRRHGSRCPRPVPSRRCLARSWPPGGVARRVADDCRLW